jgi:hypothetical protein
MNEYLRFLYRPSADKVKRGQAALAWLCFFLFSPIFGALHRKIYESHLLLSGIEVHYLP